MFCDKAVKKQRWHLCQHLERGSRQQSSDCFLSGSETGGHHGPLLQQYDSIIFIPNFSLLVLGKHGKETYLLSLLFLLPDKRTSLSNAL